MYLLIIFILLFSTQTFGLAKTDLVNQNQKNISTIKAPGKFIDTKLVVSSKSYDLKTLTTGEDINGTKHLRYQQYYKGMPVFNYQITSHIPTTKVFADRPKYMGKLLDNLPTTLKPDGLTPKKAINIAIGHYVIENNLNKKTVEIFDKQATKIIFHNKENDTVVVAYKVEFFADKTNGGRPANPNYIIDADNGSIIKYYNNLQYDTVATGPGGNEKVAKYEYGIDLPKLDVRVSARGQCFMVSDRVRTINLNQVGALPLFSYDKTHQFNCYRNDTGELNGGYSPLNDAHYNAQKTLEMFAKWYGENLFKSKPAIRVNYSENCVNAFWYRDTVTTGSGRKDINASYDFMCGGADDLSHPLVSQDVIAHELAHGVTEKTSALFYDDPESGGLNESFSDMTGQAANYFVDNKTNWKIGDKIMISTDALRYMDNPEKDSKSISDAAKLKDLPMDLQDPHYTSGVYNKAFYLLATTQKWDVKKAYDVFYHANKYYWVASTNFAEAALAAIYSAEDLGYEIVDVIQALDGVGISCTMKACVIKTKEK